jgi:hypothetical protein
VANDGLLAIYRNSSFGIRVCKKKVKHQVCERRGVVGGGWEEGVFKRIGCGSRDVGSEDVVSVRGGGGGNR